MRYSLRTLLIVMMVLAVPGAVIYRFLTLRVVCLSGKEAAVSKTQGEVLWERFKATYLPVKVK